MLHETTSDTSNINTQSHASTSKHPTRNPTKPLPQSPLVAHARPPPTSLVATSNCTYLSFDPQHGKQENCNSYDQTPTAKPLEIDCAWVLKRSCKLLRLLETISKLVLLAQQPPNIAPRKSQVTHDQNAASLYATSAMGPLSSYLGLIQSHHVQLHAQKW